MKRKSLLTMMLMFLLVGAAWAQRTVTGVVLDETGEALPGATVQLKGTTKGTTTNIDGQYSLQVPGDDAVLVFSFVNYTPKEIVVGGRSTIDVSLSIMQTEAVVVTGYGEIAPKELTGAASVIEADKIEQVPIASFDQILQGQASGLMVTGGNGQPGAAARVRIRGEGSITGSNEPLYMLDGVPIEGGTFATLNPNDFESVTVLKDAAGTAIYGSRGSNGVIVITTKKGLSGKTQVNYRFQYGWSDFTTDNFNFLNTEQKIQRELQTGQGLAPRVSDERLAELRQIDNNWQDILFRTGITQSHEVNLSGGGEKTRFYISANYFTQEGITLDSKLDRYTVRANVSNQVNKNLSIGLNTSLGFSQEEALRNVGLSTANPFLAAFLLNPYDQLIDPETGEYLQPAQGTNTFALLEQSERNRDEYKIVSNVNATYKIPFVEGLSVSTNWGIDLRMRNFEGFDEPFAFSGFGPNQQGSIQRSFNRRTRFIGTNSISYSRDFGEDHALTVGLFHEVNYEDFKFENFTGFGLDRILEPNGATPGTGTNGFIPTLGGGRRDNALLSYFANATYGFKDKYFLNATVRRDGSSRFGANNRFANFFAVGASWNIIDEDFMADLDFVDNLKFRISYGTTGNQFVGGATAQNFYPSRATFAPTASYNGLSGTLVATPGNPDLKWEVANKFNTGLDFAFLNSRISGSVDYYHETTSDLFISQQLSRTTGFTNIELNQGTVVNEGIELVLKGDVVRTNDLRWSVNGNFTYNDNRVTDLGQVDEFEQGTSIIREGLPLGSHFVVGYAGVDPENGAPLYFDLDGNVTPDFSAANATANWGTFQAPYFGGFGTDVSYKGFALSAFFIFLWDQYTFNNNQFFLENPNFSGFNQHVNVLNTWQNPGDVTDVHSIAFPTQINSSRWIQNSSFTRLRNLTVSYTTPQNVFANNDYIRNVRVFVQGQNLLTFFNDEYTGFDPEALNNIDQGRYPMPRTITVGVDVGF